MLVEFPLKGKPVLMFGRGDTQQSRAGMLSRVKAILREGGDLWVFTNDRGEELQAFASDGSIRLHPLDMNRPPTPPQESEQQAGGCPEVPVPAIVFCTPEAGIPFADILSVARRFKAPLHAADTPEETDLYMVAQVNRDPVHIGITTQGTAPVLAGSLRRQLEADLPRNLGKLALSLQRWRSQIAATPARRETLLALAEGPAAKAVLAGQAERAEALARELLQGRASAEESAKGPAQGFVYLVGAGPGNVEMLSLRALQVLRNADIIIYDRLITDDILNLARPEAEKLYVGKAAKDHSVSQSEIHQLLIRHAREGKQVCRLKGGDPAFFGRTGEEMQALTQGGIDYEVVPGVTAASACSAWARIPLTHRDHAHSCYLLTGHGISGDSDVDWDMLARSEQTLVIYMGLTKLPTILNKLRRGGMSAQLPAVAIQWGGTDEQVVVQGCVADLDQRVHQANLGTPTLIVLGSVVGLRNELSSPLPAAPI